tara:strand:+ start:2454 stop:4547 length:2094 start_codon:yes stop_codon:yes gene_type:complete
MSIAYGESPLFAFALIADSHMNPGDENSSPFETNALANSRSRYVIEAVNRLEPDFVIHMGDLVHPVPGHPTFGQVAEDFNKLFESVKSPLHIIPGNHDCGDKKISWMPAVQVNDTFLKTYEEYFGPHYGSFDHKGVHFVLINSPVLNSGLDLEAEQRAWLEKDLADTDCERILLFTHYPPYVTEPDEETHYDNIDEPARSWLLDLIEKHRVEAVFAGHVHNFFYNRQGATEHYVLPSVAFVRHDYAEFHRTPPQPGMDGGRNDMPKLGYFLVEVYENGHIAHNVRSYGHMLADGEAFPEAPPRLPAVHSRDDAPASVGVQLRHPWNEVTTIPHNYALDEFMRKKVRNDYPLMALWEMGVKKFRTPAGDLIEAEALQRMRDLKAVGHEFTVFTYGTPGPKTISALSECRDAYDAIEFIVPEDEAEGAVATIRDIKASADVPIFLSALHSLAESAHEGGTFKHLISSGFPIEEREHVAEFVSSIGAGDLVDGVVFRVDQGVSAWSGIQTAQDFAAAQGKRAIVNIRFASDEMTGGQMDDLAMANRVAEATAAALAADHLTVFLDTLVDQDRGYFIRNGLIDRRFNPRLAAWMVRSLHAVLKVVGGEVTALDIADAPGGRVAMMHGADEQLRLFLMLPDGEMDVGAAVGQHACDADSGAGNWVNLETGDVTSCTWQKDGDRAVVEPAVSCSVPSLLIAHR